MKMAGIALLVNTFFLCVSLWVAFSPKFRPMSWRVFYFNLGAAAINLFAVILHTYNLVTA